MHRRELSLHHKQYHIRVNGADKPYFENSDTQLSNTSRNKPCMEQVGSFPLSLPLHPLPHSPRGKSLYLRIHFADLVTTALANALSKERTEWYLFSQRELWINFQSTNKVGKGGIISTSLLHLSAQQMLQLTKGHCS